MDEIHDRTKTDTGRHGEKPQALERMVVKELGKFTPYVRKKGALTPPLNRSFPGVTRVLRVCPS